MFKLVIVSTMFLIATGCAGPNPNPGERTADKAWNSGNYQRAFEITKPRAEANEPWAQLRMGIFYANGWGTNVDLAKAEYWYKKASVQKAEGDWAEGKLVGATGKSGYFNQNSDAIIAEFNLAQLYYENNKNLDEAMNYINNVIKESNGYSVFFCCEFAGGRYFNPGQFTDLKKKIEEKMSKE